MLDRLSYAHPEENLKDDENQALKLEVSRLTNELEIEKKSKETLKKNYESSKRLDEQLNIKRPSKVARLNYKGNHLIEMGIHTTERGESSKKVGNKRNIKRKKPIC